MFCLTVAHHNVLKECSDKTLSIFWKNIWKNRIFWNELTEKKNFPNSLHFLFLLKHMNPTLQFIFSW